jgi:hypothetical protein
MSTQNSDTLMAKRRSQLVGKSRDDAACLRGQAKAVAGHDKWFRSQVDLAVREADAPNAQWVGAAGARGFM